MKIFEKNNKLNFTPLNSDEAAMSLFKSGDSVYMPPIAPVPDPELTFIDAGVYASIEGDLISFISQQAIAPATLIVTEYEPAGLTLDSTKFDVARVENHFTITPSTLTVSNGESSKTYMLSYTEEVE